jgi:hypothetical protein
MAWLDNSPMAVSVWEDGIDNFLHLVKPFPSLGFRAGNDNAKGPSVKLGNAA